jgi:thymidylate kinase
MGPRSAAGSSGPSPVRAAPIIGGMTSPIDQTGMLVAAEGLDGSGKTATLELLARWLERKGRTVHIVPWEPSPLVRRAARDPRARHLLTPRVGALLGAADAVRMTQDRVRPLIAEGDVVLADRYAWTAIAREIARGLDPSWAAELYRPLPRPDLVLLLRANPRAALGRALATRPASTRDDAIASAFGEFLGRLVGALDLLATGAAAAAGRGTAATIGPWDVRAAVLEGEGPPELLATAARDAIRPLLISREEAA